MKQGFWLIDFDKIENFDNDSFFNNQRNVHRKSGSLLIRACPIFFDQVGHETMYASRGFSATRFDYTRA